MAIDDRCSFLHSTHSFSVGLIRYSPQYDMDCKIDRQLKINNNIPPVHHQRMTSQRTIYLCGKLPVLVYIRNKGELLSRRRRKFWKWLCEIGLCWSINKMSSLAKPTNQLGQYNNKDGYSKYNNNSSVGNLFSTCLSPPPS